MGDNMPSSSLGRMPTPVIGSRVTHTVTKRTALVIGRSELTPGGARLLPVAIEGSTRQELWPIGFITPMAAHEQPVALGGTYTPPAGYPLKA
jgi:hypothetical protein